MAPDRTHLSPNEIVKTAVTDRHSPTGCFLEEIRTPGGVSLIGTPHTLTAMALFLYDLGETLGRHPASESALRPSDAESDIVACLGEYFSEASAVIIRDLILFTDSSALEAATALHRRYSLSSINWRRDDVTAIWEGDWKTFSDPSPFSRTELDALARLFVEPLALGQESVCIASDGGSLDESRMFITLAGLRRLAAWIAQAVSKGGVLDVTGLHHRGLTFKLGDIVIQRIESYESTEQVVARVYSIRPD